MVRKSAIGLSLKDVQLVGVVTGSLKDSAAANINCDNYLAVIDDDGNELFLPLYNTKA